jgi:hypothetical protein
MQEKNRKVSVWDVVSSILGRSHSQAPGMNAKTIPYAKTIHQT